MMVRSRQTAVSLSPLIDSLGDVRNLAFYTAAIEQLHKVVHLRCPGNFYLNAPACPFQGKCMSIEDSYCVATVIHSESENGEVFHIEGGQQTMAERCNWPVIFLDYRIICHANASGPWEG
jgi:hypothetical protein